MGDEAHIQSQSEAEKGGLCNMLGVWRRWTCQPWIPGDSDSKESSRKAGDLGSVPGLGRFPGQGNGYPLQYSCLKNSIDWGAWWATVHGVAELDTTEQIAHTHTHTHTHRLGNLEPVWAVNTESNREVVCTCPLPGTLTGQFTPHLTSKLSPMPSIGVRLLPPASLYDHPDIFFLKAKNKIKKKQIWPFNG